MIFKAFIFFSLACSFLSCQRKDYDNEFIAKYGDESFSEYVNAALFFRSLDEHGNLIYFYSPPSDTCEAPYIVTVDPKTSKPISVDMKLRKPPCDQVIADTLRIRDLTEQFLKYKVSFLKVDKDSVVYVNVDRGEEADLIRLPKSISPEGFKGFKNIKNNWYSKK